MEVDRKKFLKSLGGPDAASRLDPEKRADALEEYMMAELNRFQQGVAPFKPLPAKKYPSSAEVEQRIKTKPYREGVGFLFASRDAENVKRLQPMPPRPTLFDFFNLRFMDTANHVLQSANLAMKNGLPEELILACLLHDVAQAMMRTDHGWWGGQPFEPYVPEKGAFALPYHQA